MTFRQNGFGLGLALSLASASLTFLSPALAQDEPPLDTPEPEEPAEEAPAEPAAPEPEPEPEPEPPPAEPEATAQVDAQASLGSESLTAEVSGEADAPAIPDTASGTSAEREAAVSLIGLEQLPGSAYPAVQVRGIKYGSLWRTFHGQQWPYMPMIGGKPGMRVGISGGMWNDLSNARIDVDERLAGTAVNDQNRWTTQSRGTLRLTPTYNAGGDWFAQGNAEFIVQGDMRSDPATGGLTTTDDVWVRFGKWNLFDVTVGRFQGWEIANHYGMALDQNTLERSGALIVSGPGSSLQKPTDGYGLTYFWDRQNFLLGSYALHVYPTDYLRAEILGHIGTGSATTGPYQMDVRPSAIFDIGWVKVKAGWEYGKAIPQDKTQRQRDSKNGFGFAAQFVLDPWVDVGGSFARGFQDVLDKDAQVDLAGSNTVQTFGGFLNVSPGIEPLVFGFGAFWNSFEDMRVDGAEGPHQGKVDTNDQRLLFGAVQYTVWDQLYLKLVVSHAHNHVEHFNNGIYTNEALSGRFRAEFLF